MNILFIIGGAIFLLPFIMLILLIFNLKKANKIANDKFKRLTTKEKKRIHEKETEANNLLKAYFSKDFLSDIIVKNMCDKEFEEQKDS